MVAHVASVLTLCLALQAPVLLDRTVAIVGGRPLLQSDVLTAQRLGLIEGEGVSPASVGRLDRELQLREAERFFPLRVDAAAIDARLADLERRAGGREAVARVLVTGGFTPDRLRAWIRDDLHVQAYLRQRFAAEEHREALLAEWSAHRGRRAVILRVRGAAAAMAAAARKRRRCIVRLSGRFCAGRASSRRTTWRRGR